MINNHIWTYWHDDTAIPLLVERCIDTWRKTNPNVRITILSESNVAQFVSRNKPEKFNELSFQKKSNWYRTAVIYENGGIWLDATIVLTEPLQDWVDYDADFFGFLYPTDNSQQIENWFIAAPQHSELIRLWLEEYEFALQLGGQEYCKQTKTEAQTYLMPYLFHQLALLKVLERGKYRWKVKLLESKDSAYAWHTELYEAVFNCYRDLKNLVVENRKNFPSPLYKLTGWHRTLLDEYINRGCNIEEESIIGVLGLNKENNNSMLGVLIKSSSKKLLFFKLWYSQYVNLFCKKYIDSRKWDST